MQDLLNAALDYIKLGWKIFPLSPGTKIPVKGSRGVLDATDNEDQIRKWWEENPLYNIGLACGKPSGVYVVDIDIDKEKGVNGYESLKEFPELPKTVCQNTPRGGTHFLYRCNNSVTSRNGICHGIDIRSDGYYIVLSPSRLSDGRSYIWNVGLSPSEYRMCDYPKFLMPKEKPRLMPWEKEYKEQKQQEVVNESVLERASRYLASIEPAVQGNNGHAKLLWAASALIHGFGLSDQQAYDLLSNEYNDRCNPPWDLSSQKEYRDFYRKITEARRLTPQNKPGWLLNEYQTQASNTPINFDLEKILENSQAYKRQEIKHTKKSLDHELDYLIQPCGIVGKTCQWINSFAARDQPFLTLGATLAFYGALFGRKVKDIHDLRTNIYCMGVAQTSAGKNHAIQCLRNLGEYSGSGYIIGGETIASDSSIETRLAKQPNTIFIIDELGRYLSYAKSGINKHHAQVISTFMRLYSSASSIYKGREYADGDKQRTIVEPCCCIYGASTPERFTEGLSSLELVDGFLSRCLVFYSESFPPKNKQRYIPEIPQDIIDYIFPWTQLYHRGNDLASLCSKGLSSLVTPECNSAPLEKRVITYNPNADHRLDSFEKEAMQFASEDKMLAPLWFRAQENAKRIALIIACGNDSNIDESIADYSCRLVRYLLWSFGKFIAPNIVDNSIAATRRKALLIVEHTGTKGIHEKHLLRKLDWLTKDSKRKLLLDLEECEDIKGLRTEDKGTFYWTTENFEKLEKK